MSRNENPIQALGRQLTQDCPDATVTVDKPKKASCIWLLDIIRDGHSVNVP